MPVDWVDGVTWVNAANLEIMEADIAAKQVSADKGAANGYAPLDASSKVPLVNLPPVSGVDYIGTWGAAVAYKKGDVVTYQGKDYMAVNDSTGVAPPAAANPIPAGASYGTTLPTAPFDGQEAILVDSVTAPTYSWRFRYNAGSTYPEKWEFIGGSPLRSYAGNSTPPSTLTTWVACTDNLPAVTVPRNGVYLVSLSFRWLSLPAQSYGGVSIEGAVPAVHAGAASPGHISVATLEEMALCTTTRILRMNVYLGAAGITGIDQRVLTVIPVRVA